jgi:catechol 2,3-dioxygenase-like lactoylglutathione lyase family enzyme
MAYTHAVVGTNDLERAKKFFDAVFAPLGMKQVGTNGDEAVFYGAQTWEFIVTKPKNGLPATYGNGATIGFLAPDPAAVDAFHKAALANGGFDEGAPGPRPFDPNAYGAYIRDPDGNKYCAFSFKPA